MTDMRAFWLGTSAIVCAAALPSGAEAQVRRFDIPSQPASTGIPLFAHQAGIQILAPAAVTQGLTVNRIATGYRRPIDRTEASAARRCALVATRRPNPRARDAGPAGRRHPAPNQSDGS